MNGELLKCTCEAPAGAVHNPGCPLAPEQAIWTPPEKLDANVQRMAWLLFLEQWKRHAVQGTVMENVEAHYTLALEAAKIVRKMEQAPQ